MSAHRRTRINLCEVHEEAADTQQHLRRLDVIILSVLGVVKSTNVICFAALHFVLFLHNSFFICQIMRKLFISVKLHLHAEDSFSGLETEKMKLKSE